MFHNVTCRAVALAACGWLIACDASAFTAGCGRGAVLAGGRPGPGPALAARQDEPCAGAQVLRVERRAPGKTHARLELQPLEGERDPVLRLSTQLRSVPAGDPQRRPEAAALWVALQKSPDEALQDATRLSSVERELDVLRKQMLQHAAAVAHVRAEVERTQGERGLGWLVAALSGVLLALCAWVGWRWWGERRLQRVGRWFDEHGEAPVPPGARGAPRGLHTQPAAVPQAPPPAPAPRAAAPAGTVAAAAPARGMVLPASSPAARAAMQSRPLPAAPGGDFEASRGAMAREVGVQEVIDVHDKADFFRSIGEHEQAIGLLEAHVHGEAGRSALPWLDLLELYHARDRRADYERLRAEFGQRFAAGVPAFEQFEQAGGPLENHGRALSRIVALWPSPRVLDAIEDAIFRQPGLPGAEPFGLQAYRELVLLYHLARDLSEQGQVATTQPILPEQAEPVLPAAPRPDADRERLMVPPPSVRLGVDIDLGELQAAAPAVRTWPALDFDLDEPDTLAPADTARKEA